MTEERLEQLVEGAAGRFDRSMNRAWEHRPVRLMGGALSLLTGAGLIAKAMPLAQEGRAAAARVCPGRRQPGPPGGGRPHPVPPPEMSHPFSRGKAPACRTWQAGAFQSQGERRCLPRQAGPQAAVPAGLAVVSHHAGHHALLPHHNEQAAGLG